MFKALRKNRRFGFAPAILWLALQFFMTGAFLPANASTQTDESFAERIIICTPTGFKYITIQENGSFSDDPELGAEYCPWCNHFGKTPTINALSNEITFQDNSAIKVGWIAANEAFLQRIKGLNFSSRAPPL